MPNLTRALCPGFFAEVFLSIDRRLVFYALIVSFARQEILLPNLCPQVVLVN